MPTEELVSAPQLCVALGITRPLVKIEKVQPRHLEWAVTMVVSSNRTL